MWTNEHTAETTLDRETVWAALRDLHTGTAHLRGRRHLRTPRTIRRRHRTDRHARRPGSVPVDDHRPRRERDLRRPHRVRRRSCSPSGTPSFRSTSGTRSRTASRSTAKAPTRSVPNSARRSAATSPSRWMRCSTQARRSRMTRFPEGPATSPGFLLWHTTLRWQRVMAAALAPLDLTHVQFVILASTWWLNGQGEHPKQSRLSEYTGSDARMTSEVVGRLIAKGLLERTPDPEDARAKVLTVTLRRRRRRGTRDRRGRSRRRSLLRPGAETPARPGHPAPDPRRALTRPIRWSGDRDLSDPAHRRRVRSCHRRCGPSAVARRHRPTRPRSTSGCSRTSADSSAARQTEDALAEARDYLGDRRTTAVYDDAIPRPRLAGRHGQFVGRAAHRARGRRRRQLGDQLGHRRTDPPPTRHRPRPPRRASCAPLTRSAYRSPSSPSRNR